MQISPLDMTKTALFMFDERKAKLPLKPANEIQVFKSIS